MTVVDPIRDERGWAFRDGDGYSHDPINGFAFLSEAYLQRDPAYRGRVTVPVHWDTVEKRIVSNSDDDIMRMLGTEFDAFGNALDLYPLALRADFEALNERIYARVNDGVYKSGFAISQRAYEHNVRIRFDELDALDARLADRRYLFGIAPTETDWRLFVTLVRCEASRSKNGCASDRESPPNHEGHRGSRWRWASSCIFQELFWRRRYRNCSSEDTGYDKGAGGTRHRQRVGIDQIR